MWQDRQCSKSIVTKSHAITRLNREGNPSNPKATIELSDLPFTKRSGEKVCMPWKERSIVEERMRFVLRLKDGGSMASLCREFGISRVTGYKIFDRYKECGLEGLTDRARTPYRYANKLPAQLEAMIVSMRREKPTWGARKLREWLLRKL